MTTVIDDNANTIQNSLLPPTKIGNLENNIIICNLHSNKIE